MIRYIFFVLLVPINLLGVFRIDNNIFFSKINIYNPATITRINNKLYFDYNTGYSIFKGNGNTTPDIIHSFLLGSKIADIFIMMGYNKIIEYESYKRNFNLIQLTIGKRSDFFRYGFSLNYVNGQVYDNSFKEEFNDTKIGVGFILNFNNLNFSLSYKQGWNINGNIRPNNIRGEWFNSILYKFGFIKLIFGINYASPEYYRNSDSSLINKEIVSQALTYFIGSLFEKSSVEIFQNYYVQNFNNELVHILLLGFAYKIVLFKSIPVKFNLISDKSLNNDTFFKIQMGIKCRIGGVLK